MALMGQGYAVARLRQLPFLQRKRIFYWGDLDAHGFEILAVLRREFGHVESVMMDAETWNAFAVYRHEGVPARNVPEQFERYLTPPEMVLFAELRAENLRLEQEHVSHAYAVNRLRQIVVGEEAG